MPRLYSDLPKPVIAALLEETGYELSDEKSADIKILASQLPPAPYKIGEIIDRIRTASLNFQLHGIEFDLGNKTASQGKIKVSLTEKEVSIMQLLKESGTQVSKEDMMQKIWQYSSDASTNTVETHIYRLRQKLTENFGIEVIDTLNSNYSLKR